MNIIDMNDVKEYVKNNVIVFHRNKVNALAKQNLKNLIKKKNPYLFRAKNILTASEYVSNILEATISSSEEKIFGDFLEELAIFVSHLACNGQKSSTTGMDLEYIDSGIHYIVSIKSGVNWGNSSQQNRLKTDFGKAITVLKQSNHTTHVEAVLGICYGKTKDSYWKGTAHKKVGQSFWHLISGDRELYKDIIIPLGHEARTNNDIFINEKSRLSNLFTSEFINNFCFPNGDIDWKKIVEFSCKNL